MLCLEGAVHFGAAHDRTEAGERAFLRNLAGRAEKAAPRRSRERPAHTDAAHAQLRELSYGTPMASDQHIDGFGSDRVDYGPDIAGRANAWSVETVGSSFGKRGQASHGRLEVRPSDDETF